MVTHVFGEGIEIDGLLDDVLGKPLAEALVGCDLDLLENVTYHCCLILIFNFMFLSCALLVGRGGSSNHLQSYHIPNARLRASFDKMGRFDALILLWGTEVVGDEGD